MAAMDSWASISENKVLDQGSNKAQDAPKINYMKFNKSKHKFRLVGELFAFYSVYVAGKPCVVSEEHRAEFTELGLEPTLKFVCNAFDRTNGPATEVCVIEKGPGLFKSIISFYEEGGKTVHPGKEKGSEWCVTIKGSGRNTKYESVIPIFSPSPFTEKEVELIKSKALYDLKDRYDASKYEKRQLALLAGLRSGEIAIDKDDDDTPAPAKSAAPAAKTAAKPTPPPTDEDDLSDILGSLADEETVEETPTESIEDLF